MLVTGERSIFFSVRQIHSKMDVHRVVYVIYTVGFLVIFSSGNLSKLSVIESGDLGWKLAAACR